jgi:hypothetical protein
LCKIFICLFDKNHWNGTRCAFSYHNDKFFGLARSDYIDVLGMGYKENGQMKTKDKIKKELALWKPASEAAIERNACFMAQLCADENTATSSSRG